MQQQLLLVCARFIIICPMYCSGIDSHAVHGRCGRTVVAVVVMMIIISWRCGSCAPTDDDRNRPSLGVLVDCDTVERNTMNPDHEGW